MRRLVACLVLMVALLFPAGASAAAPGPTPTGFTGACNMLQSWGVGAQGGMENAMSRDNPNGNLGMFRAVDVSGCS